MLSKNFVMCQHFYNHLPVTAIALMLAKPAVLIFDSIFRVSMVTIALCYIYGHGPETGHFPAVLSL